ncbi:unnamed protein product [Adineta ricciae]|uniref:EF-hand domain-containing protein n=1 Tax=Adineta ricciae TaxID=249248 RepID=A0A814TMU1_ADIRI|nr:unnamed protein product [Adineta ricciae]CAF1161930.1 unnamed protein product [Adineta ricciae]
MLDKCQIVPALASAVHGVIEELPHLPETPSPQLNRSRLASSTSSTTSPALMNTELHSTNHFASQISSNLATSSLSSNGSRTTQQLDVRKAFAYFDKNGDGRLSIKEFKSVMQDLGYKPVDKRFIKQMFAEANRNGNGRSLGYDEFVEFLESKLCLQPNGTHQITTTMTRASITQETNPFALPKMQLDVETLFNCYDLDKNGFIEPKELRKVMKRLTGEKLSKQDIEEMISIADKNGDGLLDKSEFALLCSAF